jgi:rSAM/selenodomain-associated transferase 2
MISIIIPTYNEESTIRSTILSIHSCSDDVQREVIVADGQSTDRTIKLAAPHARIVVSARGRANQMNAGAGRARGDILLFLHADVTLPRGALNEIEKAISAEGYDGGGFSNIFSAHNDRIKRLGRIMNLRLRDNDRPGNTLFFGDNGIFVRREAFSSLRGYRDIPIMEDCDFSDRMRKQFRVVRILHPQLVLSPRRHLQSGFVKTRLQWILIRRLYQAGVSAEKLARLYPHVR